MILSLIGRMVAALPEGVIEGLCHFAGGLLWMTPRGELVRHNMRMALDITDEKKLRALSYRACCNTVELGMLGLAGQFFSDARWRKIIAVSPERRAVAEQIIAEPRGIMLLVPHTTLMEALTVMPLFLDPHRRMSVLYRSFGSPAMEKAILGRREAHGVKLLSRDIGMRALIHELQDKQLGGLLFDQNSGDKGGLISFMGRVAAASDLPDVVYRHSRAIPVIFAIKRTGFWRGELIVEPLPENDTPLTILASRWLESYLKGTLPAPDPSHKEGSSNIGVAPLSPEDSSSDPSRHAPMSTGGHASADWLWMHNRWKVLNRPRQRLGLNHREVIETPTQKKTKIFIRMPNWLGDVIMALPVLRALRQSRPDAEITLFCRSPYIPLLDKFAIADRILGVPKKPLQSFAYFASFKKDNPDFTIAFTNSLRGDIEMLMTGCKQRAGVTRQGYWRPLINCGIKVSKKELPETHQSKLWEKFFKALGLKTEVSYEPFCVIEESSRIPTPIKSGVAGVKGQRPLGFVPGSANEPAKRYPAENWRALAEKLQKNIVLFGTAGEQTITSTIAKDLPFVTDMAGKTHMASLADEIAKCSLIIGNDTGAMHLANALGVPTVVLYGPLAKPTRFHPIFSAAYVPVKAKEGEELGSINPDEIADIVKGKAGQL